MKIFNALFKDIQCTSAACKALLVARLLDFLTVSMCIKLYLSACASDARARSPVTQILTWEHKLFSLLRVLGKTE